MTFVTHHIKEGAGLRMLCIDGQFEMIVDAKLDKPALRTDAERRGHNVVVVDVEPQDIALYSLASRTNADSQPTTGPELA